MSIILELESFVRHPNSKAVQTWMGYMVTADVLDAFIIDGF